MKNIYKLTILIFILGIIIPNTTYGQYTTKKVRTVHQEYTDSLKNIEYNYVFPILGQGAYSEGFDIPYPMGVMANFFWSSQGITIDNLKLGFQNAVNPDNSFDLRPIVDENGDELLGFGENSNVSYSYNVRPDLWVLPFLNVYGIFGFGQSHTEVNINRLGSKEFNMQSVVDQGIRTAGVGVMLAGGIGPVWVSTDFNFTWNKPELLEEATQVNVMGLRMGHTFTFNKKPYRNIAIWVGAMRIKMQSETTGAIPMKDALPPEVWENKQKTVDSYWDWYNNEATIAQKIIADKTLTPIIEELDKRDGSSVVEYSIDKQVSEKWNMLLGAQFQVNKHWMIRSEIGFLGDRKSYLLSLNYRFHGIKKKEK